MKKIRIEDAVGHTLCHDMTAIRTDGFKGVLFKRGHVVAEADIAELLNIGKSHLFVWDPDVDEVHEDDAARAIAEAVCGDNLSCAGPSEGKMRILAEADGLLCINRAALRLINGIGDYTIASRPNYTRVSKGETLSGARIVPLVTKRSTVEKAVRIALHNHPVFTVKPFIPLKSGIIITGSEVYSGRVADRFEPIIRAKLDNYGAEILGVVMCPDDLAVISDSLAAFLQQGAELILLTGGMSVDPDDLTPTAIRESGARVIAQGVPIQPGNMLMIAYREKTMLVGVPGASLHFPVTSLDVFLPRIFAGIEIAKEDIAEFGEGGLCLNCPECRYPLCSFGRR